MKRIIGFTFLIVLSFAASSCEKEEFLTDRDKIEAELKAFVSSNNFTTCYVMEFYNNTWQTAYSNCEFDIENGFFIIQNPVEGPGITYHYNLSYLYQYHVFEGNLIVEFLKN